MYEVKEFVFLLTLLCAVNGVKSLDFCFDASLEGSRLNTFILKNITDVSSKIECVLLCVHDQCCRSINYMEKLILPQSFHRLCEMLHDVVYTSSDLESNSFYDYIYLTNPQKEYNSSCITDKEATQDFDLNFPSKTVDNYILYGNNIPEIKSMTIMFWINTLEAREMTVLSYAVQESAGELRLSVKRDSIIFQLKALEPIQFPVPPINDGFWHHVGVTWSTHELKSSGQCSIYLDGTVVYSDESPCLNSSLQANGVFAIGQKLLSINRSFAADNSFSGKLSQLNVWNYDVVSKENVSMALTSQNCSKNAGNIINWSSVQNKASETVVKEVRSSCTPLRDNSQYDAILTASSNLSQTNYIKVKASENVPSLREFTVAFWDNSCIHGIEYNHTSTNNSHNTEKALTLELEKSSCTLKIRDITTLARIPVHEKENPGYWHHFATTWSSSTGHWKVYLDGSLVSIVHNSASNITIPSGGPLYLVLRKSGQISRLNMWNYEVDGHAISIMANKGPLFENGNVFAWYAFNSKISGEMNFQKTPSDVSNNRSSSVYQMNFPMASVKNYVMISKPFFSEILVFSACFWAKFLKTYSAIFAYSTRVYEAEFQAFLYEDFDLDLNIRNSKRSESQRFFINAHNSWHFYCMQWRSSDGLIEYYQDAIKLGKEAKSKGIHFPSNGALILGQELDAYISNFQEDQAFQGSLAGLNFWDFFLDADLIQGMSAGVSNVNGNLLQWRNVRKHAIHGDVHIMDISEAEIPEYHVQALRDEWCKAMYPDLTIYARFIRNETSGYEWRCVELSAMLRENMCYNSSKKSSSYYSRNTELMDINQKSLHIC